MSREAATIFTKAITVTAGAYAAGACVGGKQTFANAVRLADRSGSIDSIIIADKAKQNAALAVVFFDSDPSATTFTDNAALTVADADLFKIIGVINVLASDYQAFADNSVATVKCQGMDFVANGSANIYATIVAVGTPTYAATTDLQLKVKIRQD